MSEMAKKSTYTNIRARIAVGPEVRFLGYK